MAAFIIGLSLGYAAGTETGRVITLFLLKPLPRPWRGAVRAWRYLDPAGLPRDIRRAVRDGNVSRETRSPAAGR